MVAQPQILTVLNDASGTTVVNDGSVATDGSVSGAGSQIENTHWAWNTGAGSFDGYWESHVANGSTQPWISLTGIALPSTLDHQWVAVAFSLDARASSGTSYIIGRSSTSDRPGGITVRALAPTSTGDFNLVVRFQTLTGSQAVEKIYADLTYGTVYQVVATMDASTPTAVVGKFLLDAGSVSAQDGAAADMNSLGFDSDGGYISRSGGFANNSGMNGRIYYFAYSRGVLLSDQDMADINADPAGTITGWPGASASVELVPKFGEGFNRLPGTGFKMLSVTMPRDVGPVVRIPGPYVHVLPQRNIRHSGRH